MPAMRTRFAPSPTGSLHLGGLRTALVSFLLSRSAAGGRFVLRIEDTDRARLVPGAAEAVHSLLRRAGIPPDEGFGCAGKHAGKYGPYVQSERCELYNAVSLRLVKDGLAYRCFCPADTAVSCNGACRQRTRAKEAELMAQGALFALKLNRERACAPSYTLSDGNYGSVTFDTSHAIRDDFVLIKRDGLPTYHFANVVDDHFMEITDVVRGEEWLPSTSKHLALYKCLGWSPPRFTHLPLLLSPDGSKLSKRMGSASVEALLDRGFVPEALLNFVALLGWNPGTTQEIFSLDELCKAFRIGDLNRAGAVASDKRMHWINRTHMESMAGSAQAVQRLQQMLLDVLRAQGMHALDEEYVGRVLGVSLGRIDVLDDIPGKFWYFFRRPDCPEREDASATNQLAAARDALESVDEWTTEALDTAIKAWRATTGASLSLLRQTIAGSQPGPPLAETCAVLGRTETLARM